VGAAPHPCAPRLDGAADRRVRYGTDQSGTVQSVRKCRGHDVREGRPTWHGAADHLGSDVPAQPGLFIVNIAFPAIGAAFPGSDLADLSWILNSYTIVFAAVGTWASIGAVAAALGPPLGGLLVAASWDARGDHAR
jgi:hypothetical protein